MYKDLYKNSYNTNIKKIRNTLDQCNYSYTEEKNRFIASIPTKKGEVIKIAFNDEGVLENYIDYRKYHLVVMNEDENGESYIREKLSQYYKNFILYDNTENSFKNLDIDEYKKDDFYILKEKFKDLIDRSDSPNKYPKTIENNVSSFYKLKKSIMDIEEVAAIGNISIDDIGEGDQNYFIINSGKFHAKKSKEYFICPKCNNGILNFNLEHFLKNSTKEDFKSRYKCSNSLCDNEINSFENLREKFWKDLYKESELEEEFRQIEQSRDTQYYNNYEDVYEPIIRPNRRIISVDEYYDDENEY